LIKGRQIFDIILVANEVVDEACHLKKTRYYLMWTIKKTLLFCGLEVFEKCYGKNKFSNILAIMERVTMATTLVLVNGSPTEEYKLEMRLS